ncbi:MAG: type 1 glutamine amidotransferase [Methanotrichaceae archaeon]
MRLHYLQHVPFEGLARIEDWAEDRGHEISRTLLFDGQELPGIDEFDWLVIMGGPMNIYEESKYPWLAREKRFIRDSIASNKIVLGICLGGQLIADVLGGKVRRNLYKEIGWHPVKLTPEGQKSKIFGVLPNTFMAFHWHGDTFEIPPQALRAAESESCANQAFALGKAIGLQFHLESSMDSVDHLIKNCSDELVDGKYIQSQEEIVS